MIRVRQVKILVSLDSEEERISKVCSILGLNRDDILDLKINKKSIDARDKKEIFFVYEFYVSVKNEDRVLAKGIFDVSKAPIYEFSVPYSGSTDILGRIVIVGSGPAGLMCAYILAENGYKPLVIERGKMVDERVEDVNRFWNDGKLDKESNVQFGEGGAGTFSDGKLNTLVKDKRNIGKKVFEIFTLNGVQEEIMYGYNLHIGTDKLRDVVKNIRNKIISMGGEFRYSTKLTDLVIDNGKLDSIIVNDCEKIKCNALVLAIGNSARDTFRMIYDKGLSMSPKAFAIGFRVMHKQDMIDEWQYGEFKEYLGHASYKLTYTTDSNRGVYSFCMCPGGYVVNASSEDEKLVINGMSNYERDSGVSNSAIVVSVSPLDYGSGVMDGVKLQEEIERKMFLLTNGCIPIQTFRDFLDNKKSEKLGSVVPMVKGKYKLSNIRGVLPPYIENAVIMAMKDFGKKIENFDSDDVLISGVESRTSSPIRIYRDDNLESNIKNIFPCGEGAGYSGGITTSGIDGVNVALEIIKRYKK